MLQWSLPSQQHYLFIKPTLMSSTYCSYVMLKHSWKKILTHLTVVAREFLRTGTVVHPMAMSKRTGPSISARVICAVIWTGQVRSCC